MASPKPFVVCSLSTKRYAPARKTPVKKQPPIPPPTTEEQLSVRRVALTKQASRHASIPSVVPKMESRRPSSRVMSMPAPDKMAKAQKSPPVHLVPSTDRPSHEKTFVPRPLKIVQRLKEGKLMGGCPAQVIRKSSQVTIANELPSRPSCVPRFRRYHGSVDVMEDSQGEQGIIVKVFITGSRNPGTARQKASVNIGMTARGTTGRIKATDISVKKPVVSGDCRTGTPTRWRLTPPNPIVYSRPTSGVTWSPPPSPDVSSFPSQSWTVVANVDVEQIKTPTICGDETFFSMGNAPKSLSSASPTVIPTLASPAEPMVELGAMTKISSQTNRPSAEVSPMVSAATIISPSRNGTASMDALAKVMDKSQAASPAEVSDTDNRALMMVRSAISGLARSLFRSSPRASESSTEATLLKSMGTNVSRIRKLFAPPLDKDAKVSKDPMTQIEIEMLRARKKVAGGGVVDPRLDRLGSITAMAIPKVGTSGSDVPGQV